MVRTNTNNNFNIFITGLSGLVGSGFLFHLIKNNVDLSNWAALCRESSDTSIIERYCDVIRGSSFDEMLLDETFDKYHFDTIIHISNKDQILQFAKLAVKHSVKRFIAISSTYACSRDNPNNNTAKQEKEAAELLRSNGIDYVFLRPTSIFGTRPDNKPDRNISIFTKYVKKLTFFPIFQRGKATTRPVWGRDVGLALYIILTNFDKLKNNAYIVSGDKERSFKELITLLYKLNNKKARFIYLPKWLGILSFYSLYYLSLGKIDKRESIHRLLEDKAFDTSKELIELGYSPTPFEEAYKVNKVF